MSKFSESVPLTPTYHSIEEGPCLVARETSPRKRTTTPGEATPPQTDQRDIESVTGTRLADVNCVAPWGATGTTLTETLTTTPRPTSRFSAAVATCRSMGDWIASLLRPGAGQRRLRNHAPIAPAPTSHSVVDSAPAATTKLTVQTEGGKNLTDSHIYRSIQCICGSRRTKRVGKRLYMCMTCGQDLMLFVGADAGAFTLPIRTGLELEQKRAGAR